MVGDQQAFPIEDEGRLVGLVRFSDVRKLPRDTRSAATVREVMTPVEEVSALPPNALAERALEKMVEHDLDHCRSWNGKKSSDWSVVAM
jgi:CBS domain-containing protein